MCGLPLEHVSETMRPLPLKTLRGMPAFVVGLSIVRGTPVPVVDVARLLGVDETAEVSRLVLVKVQEKRVALSVAEVVGVKFLELEVSQLPGLVDNERTEAVAAVAALDARLLVILRSWRIVPAPLWDLIEAGGERA
jgi:purine-binding chemotaxis protein CheW